MSLSVPLVEIVPSNELSPKGQVPSEGRSGVDVSLDRVPSDGGRGDNLIGKQYYRHVK